MKNKTRYLTFISALLLSAALISWLMATSQPARAESDDNAKSLTTGVIGIVEGQTARLTVYNKGERDELVRLQFVDTESKVLILCNSVVKSGKVLSEEFKHPGGVNRIELRAEILSNTRGIIGVLAPSLQIIEGGSGKTTLFVDSSGFAEFRALPVPPLVWPEL